MRREKDQRDRGRPTEKKREIPLHTSSLRLRWAVQCLDQILYLIISMTPNKHYGVNFHHPPPHAKKNTVCLHSAFFVSLVSSFFLSSSGVDSASPFRNLLRREAERDRPALPLRLELTSDVERALRWLRGTYAVTQTKIHRFKSHTFRCPMIKIIIKRSLYLYY